MSSNWQTPLPTILRTKETLRTQIFLSLLILLVCILHVWHIIYRGILMGTVCPPTIKILNKHQKSCEELICQPKDNLSTSCFPYSVWVSLAFQRAMNGNPYGNQKRNRKTNYKEWKHFSALDGDWWEEGIRQSEQGKRHKSSSSQQYKMSAGSNGVGKAIWELM